MDHWRRPPVLRFAVTRSVFCSSCLAGENSFSWCSAVAAQHGTARHGTACPHVIVSCSTVERSGRQAQSIKPVNEFANKTREGRGDANTRDKHINYTTTTPSTTQWLRLVNSTATSQPDSNHAFYWIDSRRWTGNTRTRQAASVLGLLRSAQTACDHAAWSLRSLSWARHSVDTLIECCTRTSP